MSTHYRCIHKRAFWVSGMLQRTLTQHASHAAMQEQGNQQEPPAGAGQLAFTCCRTELQRWGIAQTSQVCVRPGLQK